jgi:hypothetical protein
MLSLLPAALWLLAAEEVAGGEAAKGYSQGSYNVTLGLFIFALPGLWSLIKRSTKSKVKQLCARITFLKVKIQELLFRVYLAQRVGRGFIRLV